MSDHKRRESRASQVAGREGGGNLSKGEKSGIECGGARMDEGMKKNTSMIIDEVCASEVWRWALHEDTLMNARTAICVAAQALILSATVTTYGKSDIIGGVLCIVGGYISIIWLLIIRQQRFGTLEIIKASLRQFGENQGEGKFFFFYREVASNRAKRMFGGVNKMIARLPIVFLLVWIVMFTHLTAHSTVPAKMMSYVAAAYESRKYYMIGAAHLEADTDSVTINGLEIDLLLHLLDDYIAAERKPGNDDPVALQDLRDRLFRAHQHSEENK